jgi:hypothetical protein
MPDEPADKVTMKVSKSRNPSRWLVIDENGSNIVEAYNPKAAIETLGGITGDLSVYPLRAGWDNLPLRFIVATETVTNTVITEAT